jgi:tetratricopeptide (TPR) repeat protein
MYQELFQNEFDAEIDPEKATRLNNIGQRAIDIFQNQRAETTQDRARHFFSSVDRALLENNAIYPPASTVLLCRDALTPRFLSEAEWSMASSLFFNNRRLQYMEAARKYNDPVFFFDCDVASFIYLKVAEELDLPVFLVEVPGHNFLRWEEKNARVSWDPNDGMIVQETLYSPKSQIEQKEYRVFGYLENRSVSRIRSYWLTRSGQSSARQGNHKRANQLFREAVAADSNDVSAQNELAWHLATTPDRALRNGREARDIAEKLVAQLPRRKWLETLAAACAESGDFSAAVEFLRDAKKRALASSTENERYYNDLIEIYKKNLTYAEAVSQGHTSSE